MIPFSTPTYFGNEEIYVKQAVRSKWISGGIFVNQLEDSLSNFFQSYVTLTSNGTSALQLAFTTLGLVPGDEIIVPGYGFLAAANIAIQLGLKPIFVDVGEDYLINPELIKEKISSQTKAIVVIHTYGYVCDMEKIMSFGIPVIEDCAEAIFSKYKGYYCGTLGDIGTFSFHATKTFTTGEGGMIITDAIGWHKISKLYQSHGLAKRGSYIHLVPGNNFRMSNLHAALGVAQFEHIDEIIERKKLIYSWYKDELGLPNIGENILWSLPIRVKESPQFIKDQFELRDVEVRMGFVPPNRLNYFEKISLPISEKLADSTIVLPLHLSLTKDDVEFICGILKESEWI